MTCLWVQECENAERECYAVVCYLKLPTPLLQSSVFSEEDGYVGGCVGVSRHLRYSLPELPPD